MRPYTRLSREYKEHQTLKIPRSWELEKPQFQNRWALSISTYVSTSDSGSCTHGSYPSPVLRSPACWEHHSLKQIPINPGVDYVRQTG
jgi:hypothetical protein